MRTRWVGLFAVLAFGCGQLAETSDDGDGSGSGSGSSAAGETSGGGSSEAGGATGAGGSSASGSSSGSLTEEEWQKLVAPRTGPHEVWSRDRCRSEEVEQDLQVLPTVDCWHADDYQTTHERDCDVRPYCETAADCTEQPRGRCEGDVSDDRFCYYPLPAATACSADKDCADAPDGVCTERSSFGDLNCYPTGPCLERQCSYPQKSCATDADCDGAPGGACVHPIRHTQCRYNTCSEDADCESGDRCGCDTCVAADCQSDSDCAAEEACELSLSQCFGPQGYHCTTPDDECEVSKSVDCVFQDGLWRIVQVACE